MVYEEMEHTRHNIFRIMQFKVHLSYCLLFFCGFLYFLSGVKAYGLDPKKKFSQYIHVSWTVNDGLPQDTIKAICQTQDGFIWLGTEEGVVRFDGINFKVFNSENTKQIKSNNIIVLKEDTSGNLWIGTNRGGLIKFCNDQFTVYTTKDGLPSDFIISLCEDHEGSLWIGTDKGLACYKKNKFTSYTEEDGLSSSLISALYEDSKEDLWIGSFHGGVMCLKDGRLLSLPLNNKQVDTTSVRSICEDKNGNIWIGTESSGLYCLSNSIITRYTIDHGLSNNAVFSILEDRDGNLWIGTNKGLSLLKDGTIASFPREENFSICIIRAIYEDKEGNIWIGMRGKGLWRISDGKFTTYTEKDGLSNDFVRAIYEDDSGNLWIGTNSGLNLFKDEEFISFGGKYLSEIPIFSIVKDKKKNLWVAAVGKYGLFRFRNNHCTIYSKKNGLYSSVITAIYLDRKDNIWIGSFGGGLYLFKNDKFIHYSTKDGLYSDIIYYILEDHRGNLWVSTGIGLNCIRDEKILPYSTEETLSDEVVLFMHEDAENNLWLATNSGGLKRIKENRLQKYSTEDGLFSDKVFSILEDDKGNLWMGCGKGIFCISKKDLDEFDSGKIKKISVKAYNESDGMKTRECFGASPQVAWKTRDGKLWFATLRGLTMIDPENIRINNYPPDVYINKILVNGESYSPKQEAELASGVRNLAFSYNALSFTAPDGVKFRYKLEGYDKEWNEIGNPRERTAYYKALSPGRYCFRVMAANKDNIWSENIADFEFFIKPHFYQTYLFYAFCLFTLFLSGLGLLWARTWRIKSKELNKYKSSSLLDEKVKDYLEMLFHMMEKEKYFTDPDLNLLKFAKSLSLPPSHLSQILNIHLKQNFNDFINAYRIEEAKERIVDPKYRYLKLASIGSDVGFGSKSAFYSAFKKHSGMTPLDFRKRYRDPQDQ